MTDETWQQLREHVARHAIPPGPLFEHGLGVDIVVDRDAPAGTVELGDGRLARIRVSPDEHQDIVKRCAGYVGARIRFP